MHTRRPVTSFGLWGKNGTIRNDAHQSEDRQAHGGSTELIDYAQSNIYRDLQNLGKRCPHQFTWGSENSNPCAFPNPFIGRWHSMDLDAILLLVALFPSLTIHMAQYGSGFQSCVFQVSKIWAMIMQCETKKGSWRNQENNCEVLSHGCIDLKS